MLVACDFTWKVKSLFSLHCLCPQTSVKVSIQLFKISNQKYLLDFKKVSGGDQFVFFDACARLLAQLQLGD